MNDNDRLSIQGNTHREQIIYKSWKLWTSVICKKVAVPWKESVGRLASGHRPRKSCRVVGWIPPPVVSPLRIGPRSQHFQKSFATMVARECSTTWLVVDAGVIYEGWRANFKEKIPYDRKIMFHATRISNQCNYPLSLSLCSPFLFSFRSKESRKNSISLKNRVISYCLDTKDFSPKFRVTISLFIRRKKRIIKMFFISDWIDCKIYYDKSTGISRVPQWRDFEGF